MKSKLKILIPVLLVVAGGVYKFVLVKPPVVKTKVAGQVYVLPKEFLVNLSSGRFAKLSIGLIVAEDQLLASKEKEAPKPPEGFGTLPQEALVRDIITDTLTEKSAGDLIKADGREKLKKKIAARIKSQTDVKVEEILFTDVAVQ